MSNEKVTQPYSKYGPHPIKKSSRTIGIVMTSVAAIGLLLSLFFMKETERTLYARIDNVNPAFNFANPHTLYLDLSLINVIQGGGLILLILGIYRIIFSRKSTTNFAVLTSLACFVAIIIAVIAGSGDNAKINKTALENQHTWAEQRYGVIYDEITIREIENGKRDYKVQDKVLLNGETIATVCEQDNRQTVQFCFPGTNEELPLLYFDKYAE